MNVNSVCNDTNKLNILVKTMLELALKDIRNQGVNPLIIETYRPQERQDYLYCQGRTVDEVVAKGISRKYAVANCNPNVGKVTWTLNSVHKLKKAVDTVPQRLVDGKMTTIWNANDPQTKIIIKTMEKYGFEAGVNWKITPDSTHFQVDGEFGNVFSKNNNTIYVTKVIQKALNEKTNIRVKADGKWGTKTTDAVNQFRKIKGYKTALGLIGAEALRELLK